MLELNDNQTMRYEFDDRTYQHRMRIYVEGRKTSAFVQVPDDEEVRQKFYSDMRKYGLTDEAVQECEEGILKRDEMTF